MQVTKQVTLFPFSLSAAHDMTWFLRARPAPSGGTQHQEVCDGRNTDQLAHTKVYEEIVPFIQAIHGAEG